PRVLDVGSAGVVSFDPQLCESTTILDLFPQPATLHLPERVYWRVGDILQSDSEEGNRYDIVLMSSVLHHLADAGNHVLRNVRVAFENVTHRLRPSGVLLVFESFCPGVLALMQDILYPLYSRLLVRLLKFTYVRMLAVREVLDALEAAALVPEEIPFRQPPY